MGRNFEGDYDDSVWKPIEESFWICEDCDGVNAKDALICEYCGKKNDLESYHASTMNSRKYEHEEFRKTFWKFKNKHPELVKKFTQILKEEMGMMVSPNGNHSIGDDIPDISAEEIIRMSMSLGMSCDEILDMMIEQSKNYV